jgi:gluconokinase
MIVVLMGSAGAGKTTVGLALAETLHWPFHDADALHSPASIGKMSGGVPLEDVDRAPWLARVHALMAELAARQTAAVVACSALREGYRQQMVGDIGDVHFVFLQADRALLRQRLLTRANHFAGLAILDRQLADLEVPADALILDASQPVEALVRAICGGLSLPCGAEARVDPRS